MANAIWEAQNRQRHAGRKLSRRSVGSTLLIKGLEFEHVVIVEADLLDQKNLYVALTRPTLSLMILSKDHYLDPKC